MFNQEEFNKFILQNEIIGFFENPITYKSGRQGNLYINWRNATKDMFLLDKLTDFILAFATKHNIQPDCFFGVPEGATKIGLLTQFKWAKSRQDFAKGTHTAPMGRAKPKQHGHPNDRFFVGAPEGNITIIEDTITTGGSLLQAIEKLQEANKSVQAVICLTDRNEKTASGNSVKQEVEDKGATYYCMSQAKDLIPLALKDANHQMKDAVTQYYKKYGTITLQGI